MTDLVLWPFFFIVFAGSVVGALCLVFWCITARRK